MFSAALTVAAIIASVLTNSKPAPSLAAPGTQTFAASPPVILRADPTESTLRILPSRDSRAPSAPTATFNINFLTAGTPDGQGATCQAWTAQGQTAFQYAASIWGTLLNSTVPININACYASLGSSSILGYSWSSFYFTPSGAPVANTWYSTSLYNALAHTDVNGASAEMNVTYNTGFAWYFGTDGNASSGQYDFVSVALHEIGHGLGFAGLMRYSSGTGSWGSGTGYPSIYDRFTVNGAGQLLINTAIFPNPSTALGTQLTSNNIYFDGPNARAANGGNRAKLYAPATWSSGSSYSHLDETTYNNTPNALMTYALASREVVHSPGPLMLGILRDLGWTIIQAAPTPSSNYLPIVIK